MLERAAEVLIKTLRFIYWYNFLLIRILVTASWPAEEK